MAITFVKSATSVDHLPPGNKPHVALVGRSNVGKSSLLNHLTGLKGLAHESAEPGRTQSINVFDVNGRFYLIDLPGYGFAKASKAKREGFHDLIHDYLWQTEPLVLVLLIIDARRGVTDLDRDMIGNLENGQIPYVLVVNKIDKLSRSESVGLLQQLGSSYSHVPIIAHSNVTGAGRGELRDAIDQAVKTTSA